MTPGIDHELALRAAGRATIAGVDEAGRGCWAGPVVAAAVVLPPAVLAHPELLAGVDDSKKLSLAERERAYALVSSWCAWGVAAVPAHLIDAHGIVPATKMAMWAALLRLPHVPDALLIDAVRLAGWRGAQRSLIRGDAISLSIAAASVIAKVTRDRMLRGWSGRTPDYGMAQHKGYGTAAHAAALRAHGPSAEHRRSFRPIATFLLTGSWDVG